MTVQEIWALGNFYNSVFSGEQIDEAIAFILNGGIDAAVEDAEAAAAAAAKSAQAAAGSAAGLGDAVTNAKNSATQAAESAEQARIYAAQAHAIAGEDLVFSINGKQADEVGNVDVDAEDVGAMPKYEYTKALSAEGWYRVCRFAGTASGQQVLVALGSKYNSNSPCGVVAVATLNEYSPSIVVLGTSNNTVFSKLRVVPTGDVSMAIEVYYSKNVNNTVTIKAIPFMVDNAAFTMGTLAATTATGAALVEQDLTVIPSGNVLTSGMSPVEFGVFPRFKKLLTAADDVDDFIKDGIFVYATGDVPANAPFANASVGICFGSNSATNQRIQFAMRYGAKGYMRFRGYTGSSWLPWSDVLTSDLTTPDTIGAEPAFKVLSFEKGGTGGSNVAEARDNLGVCAAIDVASGASVTFTLPINGTFLFTSSSTAARLATLFQAASTTNATLCTDLSEPYRLTYTTDGNKVTISNASNYTAVICVMSFRSGAMYTGG